MAKIIVSEENTVVIPTKEQDVSRQICELIKQGANWQKRAYDNIRRIVFQNPQKMTPQEVFTAFESNNTLEMKAADLVELAQVTKAVLNKFQPGLVVDDVQEATIS